MSEWGERVTLWHKSDQRKVAGNAAPLRKNLEKYLKRHSHAEVYVDQEKNNQPDFSSSKRSIDKGGERVTIWNRVLKRKITGSAAPLRRNLAAYLSCQSDREPYRGQDLDAPTTIPTENLNASKGAPVCDLHVGACGELTFEESRASWSNYLDWDHDFSSISHAKDGVGFSLNEDIGSDRLAEFIGHIDDSVTSQQSNVIIDKPTEAMIDGLYSAREGFPQV